MGNRMRATAALWMMTATAAGAAVPTSDGASVISGRVGAYLATNAAHFRNDSAAASDYALRNSVNDSEAAEQTIRLLLAARRFDDAAKTAGALTEGRKAFFPQLALAVAELRAGSFKKAAARFAETGPHPFTDLLRARWMLSDSEATPAERDKAREVIHTAGRDPLRLFVKGITLAGEGHLAEAEKLLLNLASGENGGPRRALLRTVDLRIKAGNRDGARALLVEALKDDDNPLLRGRLAALDAVEPFDVRSDSAEILLSMAASLLREHDSISAAACAAVAAEVAPNLPAARFYAAEAAADGPPRDASLNGYDALFADPVYGERAAERKAVRLYSAGRVDEALALLRAQAAPGRFSLKVFEGDSSRSKLL